MFMPVSNVIILSVCLSVYLYVCIFSYNLRNGCGDPHQIFGVAPGTPGMVLGAKKFPWVRQKIVIFAFWGPYRLSMCSLAAVGNVVSVARGPCKL